GWLVYRGDAARNAASAAGNPLVDGREPFCRVSGPALAERLTALGREQLARRQPVIPRLYPLVVGNTVVVRTATQLAAYDLAGNRLVWEARCEDPLDSYLKAK